MQGFVTGIGMGLVFGAGVVVLISYFSKHVGLATGIASSGGAVGKFIRLRLSKDLDSNLFRRHGVSSHS